MAQERSSLKDELRNEKVRECNFRKLLDSLPADLEEEVIDCLWDPDFSTAAIVRALERRGYKADRHRINECKQRCFCGALTPPARAGLPTKKDA